MNTFSSYIVFELKHFFSVRNCVAVGLILILCLAFVQVGINDFKSSLIQKTEFQKVESFKVTQFINYRVYAGYGVRMLFVPTPASVLFYNSGMIPDLAAYIDSGERLNIYNPLIGKSIFRLNNSGFTDFSGIMFFFGSLLAMFFGFETFHHKEYLRTLSGISRHFPLFFSILISRLLVLVILILVNLFCAFLLIIVNQVPLPSEITILSFTLSILLVIGFFYLLGACIGTTKSILVGIPILLSIWFVLVFILPGAINTYIENKSNLIKPLYKLEMEKISIFMGFEKKVLERNLLYKYGEKIKEPLKDMVLQYQYNEFKKLNALEKEMSTQMKENLSRLELLSALFPTTNYISTASELSSRGYGNLLDFYDYVQDQKKKFVHEYMIKVFFSNYSKVEPLIKGDDNVFLAKNRLPGSFFFGLIMTLLYIIGITFITYSRFKKMILRVPIIHGKIHQNPPLKLFKGQYRIFNVESDAFLCRLYNLFSGITDKHPVKKEAPTPNEKQTLSKKLDVKVIVDNVDISKEKNTEPFLYLGEPSGLPGNMKVAEFFYLIARLNHYPVQDAKLLLEQLNFDYTLKNKFYMLTQQEKAYFLLTLANMCDASIYIFFDTARGMTRSFTIQFKDQLHRLSETGKLVLYLTTDTSIPERVLDDDAGFLENTSNWIAMIESIR